MSALTYPGMEDGWPLAKAVNRLELMAEVSREPGVLKVNELLLAPDGGGAVDSEIPMRGLQLPHVVGLAVEVGAAIPVASLRGEVATTTSGRNIVPVPVVPQEC